MFDIPMLVLLAALPGTLIGAYFAVFRGPQPPVVSWLAHAVFLTGLLCIFGPLIEIGRDPNAKFAAGAGGDRVVAHFLLFLLLIAPVHLLLLGGLIGAVVFMANETDRTPDRAPPVPPDRSSDKSGDFGGLPRFPGN